MKKLHIAIIVLFAFVALVTLQKFSSNQVLAVNTNPSFSDIQFHWANDFIEDLKILCGVEGYKDANGNPLGIFKPDNVATRAELVKMAFGCQKNVTTAFSQSPYSDVNIQNWYGQAVAFAQNKSWIKTAPLFYPEQSITRAEALKIILLSKWSEAQIVSSSTPFKDVVSLDWYEKYIGFAWGKGYINGLKNEQGQLTGYFGPNNLITRAEIAKIISNVYQNVSTSPTPSNPTNNTNQNTASVVPKYGNCQIYPDDNAWNTKISAYPIHPDSAKIIDRLKPTWQFSVQPIKPYNLVDSSTPLVPINFTNAYGVGTNDPGPYRIPPDAKYMVKTPGVTAFGPKKLDDVHLTSLDTEACKLYELWNFSGPNADNSWNTKNGAIFDLTTNNLRPLKSSSSTASGLPVFAGLVRADEIQNGALNHAVGMVTTYTHNGHILPATNYQAPFGTGAEWDNPYNPVMGMRLNLKKDYDISQLGAQAQIIAKGLQEYGAFIADGSPVAGAVAADIDPFWSTLDLNTLKTIPADAFEVRYTGDVLP